MYQLRRERWEEMRLPKQLPGAGGVSQVGFLLTGEMVASVALLLATPILSRLFTPDELGAYAILAAAVLILLPIASLRLELALPLTKTTDDVRAILQVIGLTAGVTVSISWIVILTGGEDLASLLGLQDAPRILLLLPLAVLVGVVVAAGTQWTLRSEAYARLGTVRGASAVVQSASQVGAGWVGLGPLGLILGQIAGQVAAAVALFTKPHAPLPRELFRLDGKTLVGGLSRNRRYPLLMMPSAIMNQAGLSLPSLLLGIYYGPGIAGAFYLTSVALRKPMNVVSGAVGRLYVGNLARALRERSGNPWRIFVVYVRSLLLVALLPTIVILLWGPSVFTAAFGDTWGVSGEYARILMPAVATQFVVAPVSSTGYLTGRQDLQFVFDGIRLLGVVIAFVIPGTLSLSAATAVLLYSAAMTISYLGFGAMYGELARKHSSRRFGE